MMITRKFIDAQPFDDLFDETMFMYLEDVDLAARATVMGWDNFVIPGTRAYHMGSVSSSKKDPSFSLYMTFRNNTGLIIKNFPIRILIILFSRMLKSDIASIRHLRRIGKGKAVPAVIKGRLASILFIPTFLIKRQQLRRFRIINEDYLWRLMDKGY
jgi:GT2 family glycosyltransferase